MDLIEVRIMMLKKGIRPSMLAKVFRVTRPAIAMALSGERAGLLAKIWKYVSAAKPRKGVR